MWQGFSKFQSLASNCFGIRPLTDIFAECDNSFGESLEIFNERLHGGVASKLETSSAEALMDSAAATIPGIEEQIALQEDQLSVLLGQNPAAILRGTISLEKQMPPEIPPGLPSALLERRPDVREAEQHGSKPAKSTTCRGTALPRAGWWLG